jgi:hypothetical protein
MDAYRVPKGRATVLIFVPPFPIAVRTVFLSEIAESHHGPETVSDLLDKPQAYLPVQEEDGEPVLLRKDSVRWLKVEDPRAVEWCFFEDAAGAATRKIRCVFADGDPLDGTIYVVAPEGERRVSDLVNRRSGFLHVESEGELYLVNLRHVVTVRILEEINGHAG